MKLSHAVVAALLGSSFLSTAQAALFDFSFAFSNGAIGFSGGTLTGIVRGLTDNATSAASSVEITGNSAGFGLGEFVGNPSKNSWTMVGGAIAGFDFRDLGTFNSTPDVTCCTLILISADSFFGLTQSPSGAAFRSGGPAPVFSRLQTSVPEPDTAWLLGSVAVGIGASVRQFRRSSPAARRA